jgi:hypothetical protein
MRHGGLAMRALASGQHLDGLFAEFRRPPCALLVAAKNSQLNQYFMSRCVAPGDETHTPESYCAGRPLWKSADFGLAVP